MSTVLKELRESLEILPISAVRERAVKNFGLKLNRDMTKEDIINLVVGVASKADFAKHAVDELPAPGWSRIKAFPVPGRATFPFYVGVNGYFIWIPYNVNVDVPTKILGVLNDAQEMRITTDDYGNLTKTLETSYPYQLLHTTEGPDPRPGFEVGRERKIAAKRAFADKHQYWPKSKDIQEARQAAVLKEAFMAQTTKTFLRLVNDVIDEAGDDLASYASDGSDFTTNTDAMMNRFKKWVIRAWKDIQQESFDWEWMSQQAVVNINPGIMFYSESPITWDYATANPLVIYDYDGTIVETGNTVTKVTNLTGIYTRFENFGYINLAADNTTPLSFGLKAGAEYFLTAGESVDSLVFAIANRESWTFIGEPVAANPSPTGFPATLVIPGSPTAISDVRILTYDSSDMTTPLSNTAYGLTGSLRPAVGAQAASVAVLDLDLGQDLTEFLTDYGIAMHDPDDEVVVIVAQASGPTYYGGIVKAIIPNTNAVRGFKYTVSVQPSLYQLNIDQAVDTAVMSGFGAWTPVAGTSVGYAELDFSADPVDFFETTFTGTLVSFDAEHLYIRMAVDGDSGDVDVNTLFQDFMIMECFDEDFDFHIYPSAGDTGNGFVSPIIDSGDLQFSATFAVSEGVPVTQNYIHSWKSFDWSEELDNDDFVELVREEDHSSFRIINHEDPAVAAESPLTWVPWDEFQNKFDFASSPPSTPRLVTKDNTGRWRFYPNPDRPYTILFDYIREPQVLSAFTDVPLGLPAEYEDLILWKAVQYYGEYDEQPSVVARSYKNYRNLLTRFEMQTRPKFHFKSAFSFGGRTG